VTVRRADAFAAALQRLRSESVAAIDLAVVDPALEPRGALGTGPVSKAFWDDRAPCLALQGVVTDLGGRVD
jgi:hypothetical protein